MKIRISNLVITSSLVFVLLAGMYLVVTGIFNENDWNKVGFYFGLEIILGVLLYKFWPEQHIKFRLGGIIVFLIFSTALITQVTKTDPLVVECISRLENPSSHQKEICRLEVKIIQHDYKTQEDLQRLRNGIELERWAESQGE